jgi:translocator protein
MKVNYFIIPGITFLTAFIGSRVTASGMLWYRTIKLPPWTPPGYVISIAWTVIFVLATISALMWWNSSSRGPGFKWAIAAFILNAILNVTWSYLFFGRHEIGYSIIEMIFLLLSVLALMVLLYRDLPVASLLLLPYVLWVSFATYLTVIIYGLNRV